MPLIIYTWGISKLFSDQKNNVLEIFDFLSKCFNSVNKEETKPADEDTVCRNKIEKKIHLEYLDDWILIKCNFITYLYFTFN